MPVSKKYLKSKPVCKVTFALPAQEAQKVAVAGDFNNWNTSDELKKLKNGTFKGTFDLPKNAEVEFRYVVDGVWQNDPEADRYQWNEYAAAENGVLEL
ncbi:MAG: isoamylase early set domain-containing protein [Dokdonia sp.]|jgi:1,4-alpha-glucan branching enzyme|nr:glycoside hydrolase [Cytophagaceae bacterium]